MKATATRILPAAVIVGLLLAFSAGCQTTDSVEDSRKDEASVVGDREWRDPPVGSHMKRRVRRGTPQEESVVRPTTGGKITEETDTLVPPVPGSVMLGTGGPGG